MVQGLFTADTLSRIEAQHLGEEVNGKGIGMRKERGEGDARFDGKRPDIVLSLPNSDESRIDKKN